MLSAKVVTEAGKKAWRRRKLKRDATDESGGIFFQVERSLMRACVLRSSGHLGRHARPASSNAASASTTTATGGSLEAGARRYRRDVAAAARPHDRPVLAGRACPTPEILQATPNILDRDGGGPSICSSSPTHHLPTDRPAAQLAKFTNRSDEMR